LKEDDVDFYVIRLLGDWKTYLILETPLDHLPASDRFTLRSNLELLRK